MADLNGIASAMATMLSATSGIVWSTSTDLSGTPGNDPAGIVVGPISMTMVQRIFTTEVVDYVYQLDLLVAKPGEVGNARNVALTIFEAIRTKWQSNLQLGYPTVVQDNWLDSYEIGEVEAFGGKWQGGTGKVTVRIRDNVSRTA